MAKAVIDAATAATHEIVAAPAATRQRIRLLGYHLSAAGTVTVQWKSGSTALTGAMSCVAGVPHDCFLSPSEGARESVLDCAAGEALNLTLGGAVQVSGHVLYEVVG